MNRRLFLAMGAAAALVKAAVRKIEAGYWGSEFYDDAEQQQLTDVLAGRNPFRWYGPKPPLKVATFEKELAARMQTRYALAVTSGTAALQCAVNALGIGPGDEVILPAWTWHSCYAAVVLAGALPVFAEIDASFNIDPADLELKITPQTKAVMAVHLQGSPCQLDAVLAIARRHRVKVVEDCAQS